MTPPAGNRAPRRAPSTPRRGDLVLIVTEHRAGTAEAPRAQVELAVITGITLDGRITRVQWARYQEERGPSVALRQLRGLTEVLLLPAALVDVRGAIGAAREHRWDSGKTFAPFDSLGQAIRLLAAHLRHPAAPGARLITRARLHTPAAVNA